MTIDLPQPVPHPDGVAESLRFWEFTSSDGTPLVGWTNDVDGPPVLVCNGLGVPAYGWPALLRPDSGVRAVGWHHRGLAGSQRPTDRHRVGVDSFVDDAVALMDAAGIERCLVAGWSIGVNTMFELALRHPDRVSGLFAVAGVPGDTFASLFGPLPLPAGVRRLIGRSAVRVMSVAAKPLAMLSSTYEISPRVGTMLTHSGFMLPSEDLGGLRRGVAQFLDMPIDWYMHLALNASRYLGTSLSDIEVPVYCLAGRYDVIARAADQRTAAESVPNGEYHELPGSHFLTMERPSEVHRQMLAFLDRLPATEDH